MSTVEDAAQGVAAYIAAAPIKAGAVEAAVTRSLECPAVLLEALADRATIARIVKETRAQVVVNKKILTVIVRGDSHAVQSACVHVQAIMDQAAQQQAQAEEGRAGTGISDASPSPSNSYSSNTQFDGISADGRAGSTPRSSTPPVWSLFSGSPYSSGTGPTNFMGSPPSHTCPTLTRRSPSKSRKILRQTDPKGTAGAAEGVERGAADPVVATEEECQDSAATLALAGAHGRYETDGQRELREMLERLKLDKYYLALARNEVDMEALSLMEEHDFVELLIPKGPRLKILNEVKRQTTQAAIADGGGQE